MLSEFKKITKIHIFLSFFLLLTCLFPFYTTAQELQDDFQGTYRGQVIEIVEEEVRKIPGTNTEQLFQTVRILVLDGPLEGEEIVIKNDYLELEKGDKFYFNHYVYMDGSEEYGIVNIDRKNSLYLLVAIFVAAVVIFGGWRGIRSLFALAGSFFAIFYILMPGLLAGWNPILASFLVASGILFAAIFFTHGFNRQSLIAYAGTMLAVLITSIFAIFSVHGTDLSGFAAEESVYLNFNTRGTLDFTALLLGAIIIGVLGVLDDIAITQAAVVSELYETNPQMSKKEAYKKALRVGREHVSALVNTLVLAYTGASLPLLMYFYISPAGLESTINTEIFATEIVRTIVGSVGLILTVPIVTMLAVHFLKKVRL